MSGILDRLRAVDVASRVGAAPGSSLMAQWSAQGVRMVCDGGPLEDVWYRGVADLLACIHPTDGSPPVLHEGGVYRGAWLESTGTISAEVLGRFLPKVARDTLLLFADRIRDDGLLPYKVTDDGPAYRHIQIVTPLA